MICSKRVKNNYDVKSWIYCVSDKKYDAGMKTMMCGAISKPISSVLLKAVLFSCTAAGTSPLYLHKFF